jgi:branched-chain amino acid transport system ATP-binding protein/neutral amino acid transport system ATP-binding protein
MRSERIYDRYAMLAEKRKAQARTLSGGQRQILAMAMGLMSEPKLMLLDEPTAGLSPKAADELFDAIVALNRDGLPVLMVEQHAVEALNISTRGYVLVAGRTEVEGEGRALASDPHIRRLFLGG